jgi:DNA-binding NtrC family response regulator
MKILVIDDERSQREILSDILVDAGYEVQTAASAEEGLEHIFNNDFLLVLTDLKMPGKDGIEVLKETLKFNSDIQVILMTAFGTIPSAVNAIKSGAYDYLTKPFEKDELLRVIERAAEKVHLMLENRELRDQLSTQYSYHNLLGKSKAIKAVFRLIEKIKNIEATVLITGESGTGKELVARAIHYSGNRRNGPFVPVNCGAIPENLIESELFGYVKGAFTGAYRTYAGRFEQAQKGTIFLDEIGAMPMHLQVRLLRVLQDKTISKIGSNENVNLDVRVLAATNEDLQKRLKTGQFRIDLYHRLNSFTIHLPPLRSRRDDIVLLTKHFVKKHADRYGKGSLTISPEALGILENHDYPGNVRELENIIEKAIILTDRAVIEPDVLMFEKMIISESDDTKKRQSSLPEMEVDFMRQALKESRGSIKKACKILGISYKTLQYRMQKYGLVRKDFI